MTQITIYIDHIVYADGIFTWMCNFYKLLHKQYDIEIITKVINPELNDILDKEGIKVVKWNSQVTYDTDILMYMLDFVTFPTNFNCKKKIKVIHCNYKDIKSDFKNLNDGSEFVAVSKQAAEGFTKRFKLPCMAISSFTIPYTPLPVLKIISCSRVYNNKGFERMFHLADDFDEFGIRFQWINYSEIDQNGVKYLQSKKHGLITFLPNLEHNHLLDMIADADYLVQLSDKEGYCYAVHEALMLKTPVIVTDIEAFKDIVQDGVNGYKLPLKMDYGPDVLKNIIYNVPKDFEYKEDMTTIMSKWKGVLQ